MFPSPNIPPFGERRTLYVPQLRFRTQGRPATHPRPACLISRSEGGGLSLSHESKESEPPEEEDGDEAPSEDTDGEECEDEGG